MLIKRFKKVFNFNVRAVSVACALLVSGPAVAETWNLANAYGASSIHGEGNVVFAEAVAEKTGGALTIALHHGGALGYKSADHFDAVADGLVELADTPASFMGGNEPLFLLSSLPFVVSTVDDARQLYEIAKQSYQEIFTDNGMVLLYASPWPSSGIWSKEPVGSAVDIAEVKIRSYDTNSTHALAALGAAPIQLAWADVVPQLATGGISAVLTSAEGGVGQNFVEHTPFFTEINDTLPLNFVHVNKVVFEGLSDEMQQAVLEAAQIAEDRNWEEVVGRTARKYDLLKDAGGTVVTDISEEFVAELLSAGDVVLGEWLKRTGDQGKQLVEEFRSQNGS